MLGVNVKFEGRNDPDCIFLNAKVHNTCYYDRDSF